MSGIDEKVESPWGRNPLACASVLSLDPNDAAGLGGQFGRRTRLLGVIASASCRPGTSSSSETTTSRIRRASRRSGSSARTGRRLDRYESLHWRAAVETGGDEVMATHPGRRDNYPCAQGAVLGVATFTG